MLKVNAIKLLSVIMIISLILSCFTHAPLASSAETATIILAKFNDSAYEGIAKPSASVINLSTDVTYDNAPTSLEWTLNANYFNVSIAGKALNGYENGGTLYARFKGTAGTNFNLVYQKKPDASSTVGNLRKKVTADGTWQTYAVDFSSVAGFYSDDTFAVKFDCSGWSLAAGKDYTANDKIYIDSIWFEEKASETGGGEEEPAPVRKDELGIMYIADFNNKDATESVVSGSGDSLSTDVTAEGSSYSLKWTIKNFADIDLMPDVDWTIYDSVNIRLRSELPEQSVNFVFIGPEKYTSGQVYQGRAVTSGEWQDISFPLAAMESKLSFSTNGKSMGLLRLDASGWSNTGYTEGSALYLDCIYLKTDEYGTEMNEPVSNVDGLEFVNPDIDGDNTLKFTFDTNLHNEIESGSVMLTENGTPMPVDSYEIVIDGAGLNVKFKNSLSKDSTYKVTLASGKIFSAGGAVLANDVTKEFTAGYKHGFVTFDKSALKENESLTARFEISASMNGVFALYGADLSLIESKSIIFDASGVGEATLNVSENVTYAKAYITDKDGSLVYCAYLTKDGKQNYNLNTSSAEVVSLENTGESAAELNISASLSDPAAPALVTLYAPDGRLCHQDAVISAQDGSITYRFKFDEDYESGTYTLSVRYGTSDKTLNIIYASTADSETFVSLANSGSAKELESWMNYHQGIIDPEFDTPEKIADAAEVITENRPYEDYDSLSVLMQKITDTLDGLNALIWSNMADYIHANNEFLLPDSSDYTYFKKLPARKQNDICVEIVKDIPFETVSDFRDTFEREIDDYKDSTSESSSKGSSGGGGGGGGRAPITAVSSVTNETADTSNQQITPEKPFEDLTDFSWAEESIYHLYNTGVISPSSDKRYRPADNITREEFIKLIMEAFFAEIKAEEHLFSDEMKGAWYVDCISRAYSLGVVTGKGDGTFGIGETITREDMVTIACRALQTKGIELDFDGELNFTDKNEISEYAFDYVAAMNKSGIVSGMGDGTFAPKASANRAQAAKVISALLNLYEGGR